MPGARTVAIAVALLVAGAGAARADRAVARARVEEGQALLAAGDRTAALARFEDAIAVDPDYLPAYDAAGELWIELGELDHLIQTLSRLTLRHPRHVAAWYALGYAYRKRGRPELAIACYEAYIDHRSGDPDPHFGLAMAALDLGQRDRAIAALRRYLELERRADRARFVAEARAELERLGVAPGSIARPALEGGEASSTAPAPGDAPPAADRAALPAAGRPAPLADPSLEAARALLAEGRAGSARRVLADLAPIDPAGRAERLRLLALADLLAGDVPAARRSAALALAEAPPGPAVLSLFAAIARAGADPSGAAAYFDTLAGDR